MKRHWRGLMVACSMAAGLVIGNLSLSEPAHAQFGGIAGMIINNMMSGHYRGHGGGGCGRRCVHSRDNNSSNDDSSSKDRNSRADDVAPPPTKTENQMLHIVAYLNPEEIGNTSGDGGTSKAVSPLGKAVIREDDRDWTLKVTAIANAFEAKSNQDRRVAPGDVTEHAIEQSLEAAVKTAKLDKFASFLGENWTPEYVRSKVLELVSSNLDSLFKGNSHGYAPMQEVNELVQHAALAVYGRIFEVSELMAANRGSALFVQRLYQTHGSHANDDLRQDATDMITRAANAAIGKFDTALRQNENGYALRYRAERIVFDCLSENVEKITSSETDIAEKGEIAQRIEDASKTECVAWLDKQFGTDTHAITPQQPVPLRVVWSASGPVDDSSMYGQATSGLQ